MNVKLTRAERKAIFRGDGTALKRRREPEVQDGDKLVLSSSRGGRHFLGRSRKEREETRGALIHVPRIPKLWIVFYEPYRRITKGETEWVIPFEAHDHREPTRVLSSPTGGVSREPGLKTRSGQTVDREGKARPRAVPKRGEQVESHTPESERGYGGGGPTAIDDAEAVDDAFLDDHVRRIGQENALRQAQKHSRADELREERKVAEELRRGSGPGARAAKLRAERAGRRLKAQREHRKAA